MDRPAAVAAMHRPEDKEQWAAARRTLAYGECLLMQLGLAMMHLREVTRPAHALLPGPEIDRRIRARFPFTLTAAQDRVIGEIVADLSRDRPMNRLLQGDVGSGKTVVALYAALLAVARGKQVAIMAPTEILASQHYDKIQAYLAGSRVRTALLVGGQGSSQRQEILAGLAAGSIDIVVGTHALLGEGVRFASLALVVVDEQHKFGVRQRSGIRGKGFAPHYLVMTATPIPRTLAMTVFGDLDVSVLDASPPGRGKTTTRCLGGEQMAEVLALVESKLAAGQQAYFIYPLVEASAKLQLQAARQAHRELAAGPLGAVRRGADPRPDAAGDQGAGHAGLPRGADQGAGRVGGGGGGAGRPGANVMVVMHAERFGLAQLHQLRGRIGRSQHGRHLHPGRLAQQPRRQAPDGDPGADHRRLQDRRGGPAPPRAGGVLRRPPARPAGAEGRRPDRGLRAAAPGPPRRLRDRPRTTRTWTPRTTPSSAANSLSAYADRLDLAAGA